MNAENWRVYLILCENGAFYCGISNRPQERFAAHLSGKGAKYTRLNKPVEMRIVSDGLSKSILAMTLVSCALSELNEARERSAERGNRH